MGGCQDSPTTTLINKLFLYCAQRSGEHDGGDDTLLHTQSPASTRLHPPDDT